MDYGALDGDSDCAPSVEGVDKLRLRSSMATLTGLAFHYAGSYLFGLALWTDTIAEWIMARTPSRWAVSLLETFGVWAKPLAATGGLATLGFAVLLVAMLGRRWMWPGALVAGLALAGIFGYWSIPGQLLFWLPAMAVLLLPLPDGRGSDGLLSRDRQEAVGPPVAGYDSDVDAQVADSRRDHSGAVAGFSRREAFAMAGGTVAVAVESYLRNKSLAARAVEPTALAPFAPSLNRDTFGDGLVRKRITPVSEFYGMSKNTVDPVIDPATWRLKITHDGGPVREFTYAELLSLPRTGRFVTLRCISNTLKSDLMGTAHWNGIYLSQLLDRRQLAATIVELAVIGADGHGDSFSLDYAFSNETLFAIGMNGETLNRTHGFPIRLLTPRYYGLKNVKWISELAFDSKPYSGTWPRLGYTKEPVIHTASHIDRVERLPGRIRCGGASFAGSRGIRAVRVRADQGPWVDATLEPALSEYTLTRWVAEIPVSAAGVIEARAQDGLGAWQSSAETPLFPNGVDGPSLRSVSF